MVWHNTSPHWYQNLLASPTQTDPAKHTLDHVSAAGPQHTDGRFSDAPVLLPCHRYWYYYTTHFFLARKEKLPSESKRNSARRQSSSAENTVVCPKAIQRDSGREFKFFLLFNPCVMIFKTLHTSFCCSLFFCVCSLPPLRHGRLGLPFDGRFQTRTECTLSATLLISI